MTLFSQPIIGTVAELIARLQAMPPDARVEVVIDGARIRTINGVHLNDGGGYRPAVPDDGTICRIDCDDTQL